VSDVSRINAERLEIFYKINRAVAAVGEPQIIAQTALGFIRQLLPIINRASISVFDAEKQEALLMAVDSDESTQVAEGTRLSLENYAPIDILQDGHVHIVNDLSQDKQPTNFKHRFTQDGIQSMMLAPLLARGVLLGAINLSSTRQNVFSPEHVTMIQEVASSVAIALQQAKLHEQIEARMAAAEALAEVSAVLRAAHTIDEVLAHILER
jgi:GAF domain-containing protein